MFTQEAETTHFQMRTFGAIFQYKSEAVRAYEHQKHQEEIQREREAEAKEAEEEKRRRAAAEREELESLYQRLTPPEKATFHALVEHRYQTSPAFAVLSKNPSSELSQAHRKSMHYQTLEELKANPGMLKGIPNPDAGQGARPVDSVQR